MEENAKKEIIDRLRNEQEGYEKNLSVTGESVGYSWACQADYRDLLRVLFEDDTEFTQAVVEREGLDEGEIWADIMDDIDLLIAETSCEHFFASVNEGIKMFWYEVHEELWESRRKLYSYQPGENPVSQSERSTQPGS